MIIGQNINDNCWVAMYDGFVVCVMFCCESPWDNKGWNGHTIKVMGRPLSSRACDDSGEGGGVMPCQSVSNGTGHTGLDELTDESGRKLGQWDNKSESCKETIKWEDWVSGVCTYWHFSGSRKETPKGEIKVVRCVDLRFDNEWPLGIVYLWPVTIARN